MRLASTAGSRGFEAGADGGVDDRAGEAAGPVLEGGGAGGEGVGVGAEALGIGAGGGEGAVEAGGRDEKGRGRGARLLRDRGQGLLRGAAGGEEEDADECGGRRWEGKDPDALFLGKGGVSL